ncbi:MAG: signal peptidase I [Erysipelotrichaceae bacterium]|nr:signal peptidase I [Erysipelotrichaceae bacterium]MBQ2214510.1 signal peptidase I [Erysipelotrichaceae bacterium]MBR2791731.1 signal peptidase I [Erysipelotrichaceae bacterium]MBR3351767.1 signal peptidase I [Erysipelotrichaceae bacterium]
MLARIIKILGILITALVIIVTVMIAVPMEKYVVESPSMEPELPVGSIIYVYGDSPYNIEEGDIIVFRASGATTPTTHRVVENDTNSHQFITKGDNNPDNDISPVSYVNYVGKVMFHLPVIGHVLAEVTTGKGRIMLIITAASGLLLVLIGDLMIKKKDETE